MDKDEAFRIARQYAAEVTANYNCKRMFIFGSYAREMQKKESDIDIAVVLDDFDNSMETRLKLMRLRRRIDSRIEPHPIREKDFNLSNPIVGEILKYGRLIDFAQGFSDFGHDKADEE